MPNSSTSAPPTPESLVFAAYHQPRLEIGDYEIELQHEFHTKDTKDQKDPNHIPLQTFTAKRKFRVEGERFQLKPDDIQAVFPPKGSLGDHSNVLPHIILTHSTLPWERHPDGSDNLRSWLILLVFSEAEKPETKTITLGELSKQGPKFPAISLHGNRKPSDPVNVIDVKRQVLEPLLPTLDDLEMLAHVRRLDFSAKDKQGMSPSDLHESERAVIIANRLPEPGATTTVHLVSVEGRYNKITKKFNFDNAGDDDEIRLVSLTSWRFACISSAQTFANMVKGLEKDHRSFRLPRNSNNDDVEKFLIEGFVPVRHALRQGGKTLSWYRGPFATGTVKDKLTVPVHTSDALLRYYQDVGIFDVGYASAWELGRLMALQSPTFSANLYEWKRLRDQQDKCSQRSEQGDHPLEKPDVKTDMPESVRTWLEQLSYLEGVPFKYLVPDERLLPKESIRFFQVDGKWIRCLLDGAYSIGRITEDDFEYDRKTLLSIPYTHATGILIRSDLVSGYPGLLIDAYSDDGNSHLTELRRQYLSKNILLCIFEGDLYRLDIHQKPEMLHFALELSGNEYHKTLREMQGISPDPNSIQGYLSDQRTIDISTVAGDIHDAFNMGDNELNSGHFALEMIESAEKVSFYRGGT
ncbi:MAG: hypothetical protein GDA56_31730 [Hormoscilla sp. GM7CHS1pb]|nr:hypothetical protein [Hormoscilla sp. GM7CHS1pb]